MDSAAPYSVPPDGSMIEPLRAIRKIDGQVYQRRPEIVEAIVEAAQMPRDTLVKRASIRLANAPGHIPPEALVYFLRRSKEENSEVHFQRLYEIVVERVSDLCGVRTLDGEIDLHTADMQEKVTAKVIELIALDRDDYETRLDYFEINFNHAIARLRRTAERSVRRKQGRTVSINQSQTSGETDLRIETALQAGDPSRMTSEQKNLFRISVLPAISLLPEKEQEVIILMMQDFQVESSKSGEPTISDMLGCSPRTVRNRYNSAVENLKRILKTGDPQ
ncbi:MAG: sigma-70 family RNA polymerase sigma factor [Henriciella sp.]|nr:sigma-70 family RNA polymerase sigma factor [Henriciella sp.]